MTAPPKVQAMETLIEAHTIELKLPTVRRRFRTLAQEATRDQHTPTAYLAALLEAEVTERAERRERRRLIDARFPLIKRLEDGGFWLTLQHPRGSGGCNARQKTNASRRCPSREATAVCAADRCGGQ